MKNAKTEKDKKSNSSKANKDSAKTDKSTLEVRKKITSPTPPMARIYKVFFRGIDKRIRLQLCAPTPPRAVMGHEIRKPSRILIDGLWFEYDSI